MCDYRFSFCPPDHHHATPQELANCPVLVDAFGPLRRAKRDPRRCVVSGCPCYRAVGVSRCTVHQRELLKARRYHYTRRGDF